MNSLRLATQTEIESIQATSDFDATCIILALDVPGGTILTVKRLVTEFDPVYIPEGVDARWKAIFARDLGTWAFGHGVQKYYFNVHAEDTEWQRNVEKFGAERTSTAPEFRYKKQVFTVEQPNVNEKRE